MTMKWGRHLHAVSPMDVDDIVQEIEQNIEWFCDRIVEPVPLDKQSKQKIMERMVNLGWLRQSEMETYIEITKED
jgi:hypothetical protein